MTRIARDWRPPLVCLLIVLVVPVALSGQDRDVSPAGRRYALLIGASKYDSDQLRDLPFTENDVTELAQVLRARGYRAQDVILLTEGIGAEIPRYRPGVANIRKEMRALLHRCRPPDMVLSGSPIESLHALHGRTPIRRSD